METFVSTVVGVLILGIVAKTTGWVSRWLQSKIPFLQIFSRHRVLEIGWLGLIFILMFGLLVVGGMGVLWLVRAIAQLFQ
jgi:hypothetical protein